MRSRKVSVRELLAPLIISQSGVTPPPPPLPSVDSGSPGPDLSGVLWLLLRKSKKKKPKIGLAKLLQIHKVLGTLDLFLKLRGEMNLR